MRKCQIKFLEILLPHKQNTLLVPGVRVCAAGKVNRLVPLQVKLRAPPRYCARHETP